jgi:hypothetical protein
MSIRRKEDPAMRAGMSEALAGPESLQIDIQHLLDAGETE